MRQAGRRIVAALLSFSLAIVALPTSVLATQEAEMGEEPVAAQTTQTQAEKKEEPALPSATVPELDGEVQVAPSAVEPQGETSLAAQATDIASLYRNCTVQSGVYNRLNPVYPTCTIKDSAGKTLVQGVDYDLSYPVLHWPAITMQIDGKGKYTGSFPISGYVVVDASYFKIESIPDQTYNGEQKKPVPKVWFGSMLLRPFDGVFWHYKTTYKNNVGPGIATATITTDKPDYSGSRDVTFAIKGSPKQFGDLPSTHWARGVVDEATSIGLISGYEGGRFGPDDKISRGQVAVILWNLAGRPAAGSDAKDFPDVRPDAYYRDAVRWASSKGVVSGYKNGNFGPDDNVTREQLAVMLASYSKNVAGKQASGSASDYGSMSDRDKVSSWAAPAVGWCFKSKIMSGSNGKVLPQGNATRAETAKMVVFLRNIVK